MTEAEILFPVQCPICAQEALTGFRISVVADALRTGEIRLYAACHVISWEASQKEIFLLHEYLEAGWSEEMQEACRQIDIENSAVDYQPVFVLLNGNKVVAEHQLHRHRAQQVMLNLEVLQIDKLGVIPARQGLGLRPLILRRHYR